MKKSILLVDDETDIRLVLRRLLEDSDYHVIEASNGREALQLSQTNTVDLAIIDLRMPGMDGMELLRQLGERFPDMVIIILTAHGDISSAVEATKLGAYDFLVKPASEEELLLSIKNGLEKARLTHRLQRLEGQLPPPVRGTLIGKSQKINAVLKLVEKVAQTDVTVMVLGESGTGKELIASMIHRKSKRNREPFITVDGGAFPETLAESELFGYEKGAFTGAEKRRLGKFELADKGTLFLDEIGNMSLEVQAKILRAIEQKKIYRVGGRTLIDIDVRIVTATNADLEEMVRKHRFREDLYYRLTAFVIELPPLRERTEDIPLLIDYFITQSQWSGDRPPAVEQKAMQMLTSYHWPGNIRELKNVIERAVLICDDTITVNELPAKMFQERYEEEYPQEFQSLKEAGEWGARREEEKMIRKVLNQTRWNRAETAKILQVDVKTLYNKMKKFNIK